MINGLELMTDLIPLYEIRTELYLHADHRNEFKQRIKFEDSIIILYSAILEYQVRLMCHLSRISGERALRNILKTDPWTDWLQSVNDADLMCGKFTGLIDTSREIKSRADQYQQMEHSFRVQHGILRALEDWRMEQKSDLQDEIDTKLLQELSSNYREGKDLNPERVPGTCEWFLEDPRFCTWRDGPKSSLLWVSADPGCGKSVLSKCLVDERRSTNNIISSSVCYFFFKDGEDGRTNGEDALCAILHQLFVQNQNISLVEYGRSAFKSHGSKLRSMFSELWDMLIRATKDPKTGEVVCILDALDECEQQARDKLIFELVRFYSDEEAQNNPNMKLKFLITSRPIDALEIGFSELTSASISVRFPGEDESEKIGKEINLVIEDRIPKLLHGLNKDIQEAIEHELKQQANRTYLWLYLVLDHIKKNLTGNRTEARLKVLIKKLPATVEDAYECILQGVQSRETTENLLRIILGARRPLTLREMNVALELAMHHGCRSYMDLDLNPEEKFKSDVKNICGLFIMVQTSKIVGNSTVHLIHQTARDFLTQRPGINSNLPAEQWKQSIASEETESIMARICVSYLHFEDFENQPLVDYSNPKSPYASIMHISKYVEQHAFLEYSAMNFAYHFKRSEAKHDIVLFHSTLSIFNTEYRAFWTWFPVYFCQTHHYYGHMYSPVTGLVVASHFGLGTVVQVMLKETTDVNILTEQYGTALYTAVNGGHLDVVEQLLAVNASANVACKWGETPLYIAAYRGSVEIIDRLLAAGATVNAVFKSGWTPLHAAVGRGDVDIVEHVLSANASVNAANDLGETPLHLAVKGVNIDVVERLIAANAAVNATDKNGETPLHVAVNGVNIDIIERLINASTSVNVANGYGNITRQVVAGISDFDIVERLLSASASVNATNNQGETPLNLAAKGINIDVVEQLIAANASVNTADVNGDTPLHIAIYGGNFDIVERLIAANASVNAANKNGETPLHVAVNDGNVEIVERLIAANASVNAADMGGDTPLHIAVNDDGNVDIVERLIAANASVNAADVYGETPLHVAIYGGNVGIVERLIAANASVNAANKDGGTPLHVAALSGSLQVIELLLAAGAAINAASKSGDTALYVASKRGHIELVKRLLAMKPGVDVVDKGSAINEVLEKTLLNKGADVNAQGGHCGNALQVASAEGREAVVMMLLDNGANVNAEGGFYGNALQAASRQGNEAIVKTLLDKGAGVNARGGYYGTALQAASSVRNERVVRILLAYGATPY